MEFVYSFHRYWSDGDADADDDAPFIYNCIIVEMR